MNQRLLNLFIHYLFIKTYAHEFHPAQKKTQLIHLCKCMQMMYSWSGDFNLKKPFASRTPSPPPSPSENEGVGGGGEMFI